MFLTLAVQTLVREVGSGRGVGVGGVVDGTRITERGRCSTDAGLDTRMG